MKSKAWLLVLTLAPLPPQAHAKTTRSQAHILP